MGLPRVRTMKFVTTSTTISLPRSGKRPIMQWKPLITSANTLGDCSGGALLTGSTTQWDLSPFSQGPNEIELRWIGETSTAEFQHSMVVRTTAGPPQYDQSVFMRAVCHYLLTRMPDEGLPDE